MIKLGKVKIPVIIFNIMMTFGILMLFTLSPRGDMDVFGMLLAYLLINVVVYLLCFISMKKKVFELSLICFDVMYLIGSIINIGTYSKDDSKDVSIICLITTVLIVILIGMWILSIHFDNKYRKIVGAMFIIALIWGILKLIMMMDMMMDTRRGLALAVIATYAAFVFQYINMFLMYKYMIFMSEEESALEHAIKNIENAEYVSIEEQLEDLNKKYEQGLIKKEQYEVLRNRIIERI